VTRAPRAREKDLARERERASEISEEGSPRYRASQKKDKKTAHRSTPTAAFSGKRRLLTRGSGEVCAKSRDALQLPLPNVSGVSQVGDRQMNFEVPKHDRRHLLAFKNLPCFARLRNAMKMIVDGGT